MTRFLHRLRAAWLFARHGGWCPQPEWTADDREALRRFLATEAGSKLRLILMSHIAAANEKAAMTATPFECGWACGYRGLWAWFQSLSLSPAGAEPGTSEEAEPGVAADFAHLHP
jgi:hypothetical protein